MKHKTQRAALYARVSTQAQKDNSSPDGQIKRATEYCQSRGYTIVDEKREIISGSFVLARSEFNALLEMAADGKIDVIVVDVPDRLGRGDAIGQCEILAKMNGARIEFAEPGYDKTTTDGFVRHSADQMVSGIERLNIARRSKKGRRDWAEKGRVIASSLRPYGYTYYSERDERGRKTLCKLIVIEEEAQRIRDIFTWYAIDGLSPNEIAQRLTELGISTPREVGPWHRNTVSNILKNSTYIGRWLYGKKEIKASDAVGGVKKTSRMRNESENYTIAVTVPPIIPLSLWEATQERIIKSKHTGGKPAQFSYLLRGRLKCTKCHSTLISETIPGRHGNGFSYYRDKKCGDRRVRIEELDAKAWKAVKDALEDEQRLFAGVEHQREEAKKARQVLMAAEAAHDVTIANLQAKIKRAYEAYLDGISPKEEYTQTKTRIDDDIERERQKREEIEIKLRKLPSLTAEQEAQLRQWRLDVLAGIDNATFEEQRQYLEWLKVQVFYNADTGETLISGVFGDMIPDTTSQGVVRYPMPFYAVFTIGEPRKAVKVGGAIVAESMVTA